MTRFFALEPLGTVRRLWGSRRNLAQELSTILRDHGLVVLWGPRRTGKTSIALAASKSLYDAAKGVLQSRPVVLDLSPIWDMELACDRAGRCFYEALVEGVSGALDSGLSDAVSGLVEVDVDERGAYVMAADSVGLARLLALINERLKAMRKRAVLVLVQGEALYARAPGLAKTLAYASRCLDHLRIVVEPRRFLTAEKMLRAIQGKGGRATGLRVDRLCYEESLELLRRGLEKEGVKPLGDEVSEAAWAFQGTVKWLALYGYLRATGLEHREALEEAKAKAVEEAWKELKPLVDRDAWEAEAIRRALRTVPPLPDAASRSQLVRAIVSTGFKLGLVASKLIARLVDLGVLERRSYGIYAFADQAYYYAVREHLS